MALTQVSRGLLSTSIVDNGNATAITIDSSENVGIGTSSPATNLHIQSASEPAITLFHTGIMASQIGLDNTGSLTFGIDGSTGATERMRIDSSGNVGIGTSSPNNLLDIYGTDSRKGVFVRNSNNSNYRGYYMGATGAHDTIYGGIELQANLGELRHYVGPSSYGGYQTFHTSGTERMRITDAGNVGINQSSPLFALCISDSSNPNRNGMEIAIGTSDTSGNTIQNYNRATSAYTPLNIGASILTFSAGTSVVERMRVDSSGALLVGTTSNSDTSGEGFKFKPDGEGTDKPRLSISTAGFQTETCLSIYSTAVSALRFAVNAAGTISATNTTITSLSDQRVKENVRDLDDGLTKVLQLQPRKFDWKEGQGRDISNDRGFIAQEFEQVFPDMIEEWKDKAPEGGEPYKAINANLIPTLVKAIQEQQETITTLTARIEQLENN